QPAAREGGPSGGPQEQRLGDGAGALALGLDGVAPSVASPGGDGGRTGEGAVAGDGGGAQQHRARRGETRVVLDRDSFASDGAGRGDTPDGVVAVVGEPQGAVRAGGNGMGGRDARVAVVAHGAGGGDATDREARGLLGAVVGEPQGAVGAGGQPQGADVSSKR